MRLFSRSFLPYMVSIVLLTCLVGPARTAESVCHWKMDEGSGNAVADSSAKGYIGAISSDGAASWVKGVSGQALHLPEGCRITQPKLLGTGLPEGTLQLWCRFDAGSKPGLFLSKTNDMTNNSEDAVSLSRISDGRIEFKSYLNGTGTNIPMISGIVMLPDEWYHIAITWGSFGRKLYVDGAEEAFDPHPCSLGEGNLSEFMLGGEVAISVDELKVLASAVAPKRDKLKPALTFVNVQAPPSCRQGDVVELNFKLRVDDPAGVSSGAEIWFVKNDHTITRQWVAFPTRNAKRGQIITVGPVKYDMLDAPEGRSFFKIKSGHAGIKGIKTDGVIAGISVKGHR